MFKDFLGAACLLACLGLSACDAVDRPPPDPEKEDVPGPGKDTVPQPSMNGLGLDGCWKVGFGGTQGRLRVLQSGKNVRGALEWADGAFDSLSGVLEYPYLRLETEGAGGPRRFRGNVLPAMDHFEIKLLDSPMGVVEKMIGERTGCDTAGPNDPMGNGQDTVVACWSVSQTLENGEGGKGALYLARTGNAAWGYFRWEGYPEMAVTHGPAPVLASPVYLYGTLPAGMGLEVEGSAQRVHYKARLSAGGGALESGLVYRRSAPGDFTNGDSFGSWGGAKVECPDAPIP